MPAPSPVEHEIRPLKKLLAVADFETDPFRRGRIPLPFVVGFYDGHIFHHFWGDDCVRQLAAFLKAELEAGREYVIYMHNGGRFDFMYLAEFVEMGRVSIINGRVVRAEFMGHEFRDSFALFPQALSAYKKDVISYDKFEREVREGHRNEIVRYLDGDCRYTFEIIAPFVELYGDVLTVGSVALKQLNSLYGFERLSEADDTSLRPFYYGGRVQCFEVGDFHLTGQLVDANSMYPAAMKNARHPVSGFHNGKSIKERTGFARIRATSNGCLPWKDEEGRLNFTPREGDFFATSHEIQAGLELGLLKVHEVYRTYDFEHWTDFGLFVDKFFDLRAQAKRAGDKARDLIYKRVLNSAYGKFALDPRRFNEYEIASLAQPFEPLRTPENLEGWFPVLENDHYRIWERPTIGRLGRFLNVATAASITGAARANLMRNLQAATRPLYCDTDSIICADFAGDVDANRLGAWDREAVIDRATIAAKKIYALWHGGECIKTASKGARLTVDEIVRVARGETVHWENEAPSFSFIRDPSFVKRRIKRGDVDYRTPEEIAEAA